MNDSPIPIELDNRQIKEMIQLVSADMEEYLGYAVLIRDTAKKGEDVNLRVFGLWSGDFTDEVQDFFSTRCYERMLEVAGIHDASNPLAN